MKALTSDDEGSSEAKNFLAQGVNQIQVGWIAWQEFDGEIQA